MQLGVYLNNRASVFLSDYSLEQLIDLAVEAEDLGYHSVWLGDSLLAKPRFDPIVTHAAIAARTHTIKIATGILQCHLRNPVVLALEWATLDIISAGRTIMGVGLGAGRPDLVAKEYEVVGFTKQQRSKVFEETVEVLKLLWTQEAVTFHGEHHRIADVSLGYKPLQKPHPPIWVAAGMYIPLQAGRGAAADFYRPSTAGTYAGAFERVARLADGWLTVHATPREYAQTLGMLNRLASEKYGRPAGSIHAAFDTWIAVGANKQAAREEAAWMLENYHALPGDDETLDRWVIHGTAEDCIRRLREYEQVGVQTVELVIAAKDHAEQMRRIAREILPAFHA